MNTLSHAREAGRLMSAAVNTVDYQELLRICLPVCVAAVVVTNLLALAAPNTVDTTSPWYNWIYLLIAVAPGIFLLTKRGYCWSLFGIKHAGAGKAAAEAGLLLLLIIGLSLLAAVIACGSSITNVTTQGFQIKSGVVLYFFHVCLQEFLARSFQTVLQQTLQDKKGYISVAGAGLMFGLFHLHFSVAAMLLTFVLGVVLGFIYLRQRNLIGVILLHFVIGLVSVNLPIW